MKWMKLLLPALLAASVLFCPAAEVCAAEQAACSGSFTVTKRVKESALRQEEEPVYRFRAGAAGRKRFCQTDVDKDNLPAAGQCFTRLTRMGILC